MNFENGVRKWFGILFSSYIREIPATQYGESLMKKRHESTWN